MSGNRRTKTRFLGETKDAILSRPPGRSSLSKPKPSHDNIHFLQKTIGNQAVQSLFMSGHIYPKLKIGAPNDIYEQEADRVADQVMRMQDMTVSDRQSAFSKGTVSLQRKPG